MTAVIAPPRTDAFSANAPAELGEVVRRMVPRYTSYPTAPHFSPAVTAETYGAWLDEAGASGAPISLYLHIPYCRSICHYCGCTTKAARRDAPLEAYAATLRREIALVAERLGPVEISHLHWGGGTPNILPAAEMAAIVADLRSRFRFMDDMEHAVELDPRHVTAEGARAMAALGINRASLGVQTLEPIVQKAIGRIQPLSVVADAFAALREGGIAAINADLMYGLPLQTADHLRATAEAMLPLRPDRFAIFGYAHVPWMKRHQSLIDEGTLPGAEERLAQASLMRGLIEAGGYVPIGIDHFALAGDPLAEAAAEGHLHRNFQGYTDDDAPVLIGLGASSISRTRKGFAQNAVDEHGWRRAVENGALPIVRGKAFEGDDLMRAAVIERLLCDFEVDLSTIAHAHDRCALDFAGDLARLAPLATSGWVEVSPTRVVIRENRVELARVVAAAFDTYLGQGGRHSVAV